ncbi:MAG: hypothetical protein PHE83_18295 [Opitutaceae bacterium]|nr:hypothetical protein [Opitutaceae bacterium]
MKTRTASSPVSAAGYLSLTMNISEYVREHANVTPNADIAERWETRIVAGGLASRGRDGAEAYLARYGKGLKAPKAIGLARIAEIKGAPELAARFWEEAYFLQTGGRETLPGGPATPRATPPGRPVGTGFGATPQLLVALTREEALAMVADPAYGIQEKKDGRRAMARVTHGRVESGNKRGLASILPLKVSDALASLGNIEIDAEQVDDENILWIFDLLSRDGHDLRALPYSDRHRLLTETIRPSAAVQIVPLITGEPAAKRRFIAELEAHGAEGFVLKRLDAPYQPRGKTWSPVEVSISRPPRRDRRDPARPRQEFSGDLRPAGRWRPPEPGLRHHPRQPRSPGPGPDLRG